MNFILKKIALLFVLLTITGLNVYAFDFGLGVKANVGMGLISGYKFYDNKTQVDPWILGGAGLYLEFGILKSFSIQSEVQATFANGVWGKTQQNTALVRDKYSYTGIDTNLFFKGRLWLSSKSKAKLYLMTGPVFSTGVGQVSHTNKIVEQKSSLTLKEKMSFNEANLKKFQFGLALEAGSEIPLGSGLLIIGLRTKWNLTNSWTKDFTKATGISNRSHQPFTIQVGYGFSFF